MAESLSEVKYTFELDGPGTVLWRPSRFDLTEGLSELYHFVVDLVTDDVDASLEDLLGASAELEIVRGDHPRYIAGIVRRVDFVGVDDGYLHVKVFIAPAAWVLTQRKDSRHWQGKSVDQILRDVLTGPLADFGREIREDLNETYPEREFCAQYRETDYAFACRLMAEEGIYFYFDFSKGHKEALVLCDNNASLPLVQLVHDGSTVAIHPHNFETIAYESIQSFGWQRSLKSTSVVQRDFDWRAPHKPPTAEHRKPDARGREREIYDPGERRYNLADAAAVSARKVEALAAKGSVSVGESNVIGFAPGIHFELDEHHLPDLASEHLITRVTHHGSWEDTHGSGRKQNTSYSNRFESIPFEVVFRPPMAPQRPLVQGPQTAVVTGPGSDEIHVDKHGRVTVLLAWDRLSAPNDKSSCWVRVAQLWAGAGWGSMFIPRVGMEVVVEFLDGNPDRPLITGCVYNGANPPPYTLPDNDTVSTIKTNSSEGGNGFNEIRFEDKTTKEELYFHAQKDLTIKTENDKNQETGRDETLAIGNDRTKTVNHDQFETVVNNKTITVGVNHVESIGASQSVSVGTMANETVGAVKTVTVGAAMAVTVGGALVETVGAARVVNVVGASTATAGTTMTLTCGASSITLEACGNITIKGSGVIALQGAAVTGN